MYTNYKFVVFTFGNHSYIEPTKPRFVIHPISRDNIATRDETNFSCKAFGIPRPVITWFKDNHSLPKDNRIQGIKALSVLTVDSVAPQDQGSYWCEANSDEGCDKSTIANLTGELSLQFYVWHLPNLVFPHWEKLREVFRKARDRKGRK